MRANEMLETVFPSKYTMAHHKQFITISLALYDS